MHSDASAALVGGYIPGLYMRRLYAGEAGGFCVLGQHIAEATTPLWFLPDA